MGTQWLKATKGQDKMANFLQKWFLPKKRYMVLDFIDKNSYKVKYSTITNKRYTWDIYYIYSTQFSFKAMLRTNANSNDTSTGMTEYTFQCLNHPVCKKSHCPLNDDARDTNYAYNWQNTSDAKFVRRVYRKLQKNYKKYQTQDVSCK